MAHENGIPLEGENSTTDRLERPTIMATKDLPITTEDTSTFESHNPRLKENFTTSTSECLEPDAGNANFHAYPASGESPSHSTRESSSAEEKTDKNRNDIEDVTAKSARLSILDEQTSEQSVSTQLENNTLKRSEEAHAKPPYDTPEPSPKSIMKSVSKLDDGRTAELEIQNIMEQFDGQDGLDEMPRSGPAELPPRLSSLEKVESTTSIQTTTASSEGPNAVTLGKTSRSQSMRRLSFPQNARYSLVKGTPPISPLSSPSIHKALPPAPEPESDLPFDFHRFLDQLRHRTADPVAKFLRSFLLEFGKKQWMVHEQIKIISDFLNFITGKMAQCEVWREVSDAEFDNAREGMEKLVMNRLYSQTYSPAIPAPVAFPTKGKRKANELIIRSHRRGQHQEDIERDDILAQKVRIYGWIRPEHLDIPKIEESSERFLKLAQHELLKIKSYRAPRDKVICVLNCCKVIFGLLRNSKLSDTSADSFMPLLIYVTLQGNPEHLVSNVQYILRFRNPDKLGGEAGYYVSSLMGAIQFIENLDRTSLTISDDEFEKNVELAVSAIAEKQPELVGETSIQAEFNEKTGHHQSGRGPSTLLSRSAIRCGSDGEVDSSDEKAAIGGTLKTFQKPLTNIGRMFSDEGPSSQYPTNQQSHRSGDPPETPRRLSPSLIKPPRDDIDESAEPVTGPINPTRRIYAEDSAARQASAETAEAQRITRAEHKDVVEYVKSIYRAFLTNLTRSILFGMFPNLDRDIIDDVVRMKDGR